MNTNQPAVPQTPLGILMSCVAGMYQDQGQDDRQTRLETTLTLLNTSFSTKEEGHLLPKAIGLTAEAHFIDLLMACSNPTMPYQLQYVKQALYLLANNSLHFGSPQHELTLNKDNMIDLLRTYLAYIRGGTEGHYTTTFIEGTASFEDAVEFINHFKLEPRFHDLDDQFKDVAPNGKFVLVGQQQLAEEATWPKMVPLVWKGPFKPQADESEVKCSYDHSYADTVYGQILITWKSWKDYITYYVDLPFESVEYGSYIAPGNSLEEAQDDASEVLRYLMLKQLGYPVRRPN